MRCVMQSCRNGRGLVNGLIRPGIRWGLLALVQDFGMIDIAKDETVGKRRGGKRRYPEQIQVLERYHKSLDASILLNN